MIPIAIAESFVYTKLNVYRYYIGRPGQSFDPKIRAKHGDHVTTVLKFVLAWMKAHRDEVPQNTTRRVWFDDLWWAFGSHHYVELSRFPYKIAQPRLKEWNDYMLKELPEVKISSTVKDYRSLPFPLYWIKFHTSRQLNRAKKFIKKAL